MSVWKPYFESLVAIFEGEHEDDRRRMNKKNGDEQETAATHEAEVCGTGLCSALEESEVIGCIVRTAWKKLVVHARNTKTRNNAQLSVLAANSNMTQKGTVRVAQEVFTRELISAFENLNALGSVQTNGSMSNVKRDQARISSLERRLKEMSAQTEEAKQAVQVVMREKRDLECACDEYERRHTKLSKDVHEARAENKGLRRKNMYLGNRVEQLEAEVEDVERAKYGEEAQKVRECHRAEMAELMAEQTSLHCMMLDKQLKSAERSSKLIRKHLEELERVQDEMRGVLADGSSSSARSEEAEEPRSIGRLEWLMHKSSKLVGRIGALLVRRRSGSDAEDDNEGERDAEGGFEEENVTAEDSRTPRSGGLRKLLSAMVMSKRRAGRTDPSVLQKMKRGLRHGIGDLVTKARADDGRITVFNRPTAIELDGRNDEDTRAQCDEGSGDAPRGLGGFWGMLSLGPRRVRRSGLSSTELRTEVVRSRTLEALEDNLTALREVVEDKQEEVFRLHRELRDAMKLSNALEKSLQSELHKRLEAEQHLNAATALTAEGC